MVRLRPGILRGAWNLTGKAVLRLNETGVGAIRSLAKPRRVMTLAVSNRPSMKTLCKFDSTTIQLDGRDRCCP